jgi:hypothetical protein
MPEFEWDFVKELRNIEKHGVSFIEASTVFHDFQSKIFDDEKHSQTEKRELIIGISSRHRLLIVSFTVRDNKIRIISSRQTNNIEKVKYEENK